MFFIKKPSPEYTTKIIKNCPWMIEHLEEHFDDVLCQLSSEGSYIYGGAIRDMLAKLPLTGDLDIIVENNIFKTIVDRFRGSSRWILRGMTNGSEYSLTASSKYIIQIATFFDKSNTEIQFISPKDMVTDIMDTIPCSRSAWDIVRYVDIRCSGVLLTLGGDIYEAVPGAIEDCKNRELHINTLVDKDGIDERLHKHVDKLASRCWTNKIDLSIYPSTIPLSKSKSTQCFIKPSAANQIF